VHGARDESAEAADPEYDGHMGSRALRIALASLLSLVAVVLLVRAGLRLSRAASAAPPAEAGALVQAVPVAGGFDHPLFVTHAGDGSGRLFVVEQTGKIRIVRGGRVLAAPFLDLGSRLDSSSGERGLLGLAFAPDFATSRRFYVSHTTRAAAGPVVRVARYRVGSDPDRADPASESVVLDMADPASNHNGGMLAFGPDGMLWIGTGDGGRAGDPWDNSRNPASLLGKMLRLDVREEPYRLPPGNQPAAGGPRAARGEVWALGLRNPWRYSFDRSTGELWIGDVGQNAWEEIDVADSRREGPLHFGWKTMEGAHCYEPRSGCDRSGLELPVHEYDRDAGCSVTGGYVYRGREVPALTGRYLFSDYCTGVVWSLARDPAGKATVETVLKTGFAVSSFGEDEAGEVYLCDHSGGRILRLAPRAR
jgi:glucose/arabinose dehydrogenase